MNTIEEKLAKITMWPFGIISYFFQHCYNCRLTASGTELTEISSVMDEEMDLVDGKSNSMLISSLMIFK